MGGTNGKPYDELSENEQRRVTKLIFDEIESTSTDPKKFRKLLSSDKYEISAADLDRIRNAEGVSLLYKAVELGREMLVELFLEKGCRARCCNQQLVSALQFAIQAGNKKIVEFLLDYGGADVCLSQDSHGRLPIHYAANVFNEHPWALSMLLDHITPEEVSFLSLAGENPFHIAAKMDNLNLMQILLNSNMGPRIRLDRAGLMGVTPLHVCAVYDSIQCAKLLMAKGAKRNVTDHHGLTPLHMACIASSHRVALEILNSEVELLAKKAAAASRTRKRSDSPDGEDIIVLESRDCFGNGPMHYALGWIEHNLTKPSPDSPAKSEAHMAFEKLMVDAHHRKQTAERKYNMEVIKTLLKMERAHNKKILSAVKAENQVAFSNIRAAKAYSLVWRNAAGKTPLDVIEALDPDNDELISLLDQYRPEIDDVSVLVPAKDYKAPEAFSMQIASDLHIEFMTILDKGREVERNVIDHGVGAKFLALLGDIGVVCSADKEIGQRTGMKQYRSFLRHQAKHFDKVIVIAGNHEYYRSSVEDVDRRIEEICAEMPDKLVYLNAAHPSVELMNGKVRVIGSTLWSEVTDDPKRRQEVHMSLNDYRRITVNSKSSTKDNLLTPEDTTNFFRRDLEAIQREVAEAGRLGQAAIVLTHHSPIRDFGCSNAEYWDSETQTAFGTHLRDLFGQQLVAWCYGHTHWPHDMLIDGTRIIANQGGYVNGNPTDNIGYNRRFVLSFNVEKPQSSTTTSATSSSRTSVDISRETPIDSETRRASIEERRLSAQFRRASIELAAAPPRRTSFEDTRNNQHSRKNSLESSSTAPRRTSFEESRNSEVVYNKDQPPSRVSIDKERK